MPDFFSWVIYCDLHLLKEFILNPETEPSGTTEVFFSLLWLMRMVHYCQTQKETKCFILQHTPLRKLLFVLRICSPFVHEFNAKVPSPVK